MHNLATGYWVYDQLLEDLRNAGWVRFAPGFKAGLYGHPSSQYCIKILGMGVGENPTYFCERGYYIEHEREMLFAFRRAGFAFAPEPLNQAESVLFLKEWGVRDFQAELRVLNNDVLIMEYIPGMPLATQTGRFLDYDTYIDEFGTSVLDEMVTSLRRLGVQLRHANVAGFAHNDPMPPNIIFTIDSKDQMQAKLVDFEVAQNFRRTNPPYVNDTVRELYIERNVPKNPHTGAHVSNLDMHLIEQSIELVSRIKETMKTTDESVWDAFSVGLPFIGGFTINLGKLVRALKSAGGSGRKALTD
jgi:serine/threonine protein kinase